MTVVTFTMQGKNVKVRDPGGPQLAYWGFRVSLKADLFDDVPFYDVDSIKKLLNNRKVKEWIFQFEEGETGYLHYQGWCKVTKLRLPEVRKIIPHAFWLPSSGAAAETYAMKSETRLAGPFSFPYRYSGEDLINQLRPWQSGVLRIISEPPDSRKIYWYYDTKGNVGKTALAKYLCFHHKARLIGGKTADALFAATDGYRERYPIFIVDIPRAQGNKVPYAALEALKNGLGFSSKYESKQYMGPPAHVFVFANMPPDRNMLSEDRWVVDCLDEPVVPDPPVPDLRVDLLNLPLNI